jgi:hypothetical protein
MGGLQVTNDIIIIIIKPARWEEPGLVLSRRLFPQLDASPRSRISKVLEVEIEMGSRYKNSRKAVMNSQ